MPGLFLAFQQRFSEYLDGEYFHTIPATIDQKLNEKGITATLEATTKDAQAIHALLTQLQHEKTMYIPFEWHANNENRERHKRIDFPVAFSAAPRVLLTLSGMVSRPDDERKGTGISVTLESVDTSGCRIFVSGETSTFATSGTLIVIGTPKS